MGGSGFVHFFSFRLWFYFVFLVLKGFVIVLQFCLFLEKGFPILANLGLAEETSCLCLSWSWNYRLVPAGPDLLSGFKTLSHSVVLKFYRGMSRKQL